MEARLYEAGELASWTPATRDLPERVKRSEGTRHGIGSVNFIQPSARLIHALAACILKTLQYLRTVLLVPGKAKSFWESILATWLRSRLSLWL